MANNSRYDWRGLAMLTQQLTQLFEPNKAKLLDKQHQHEMNMLMAKKSWDTQVAQVSKLETELESLTENIGLEEAKLMNLGQIELVNASKSFGNPTEASAILENNDIKSLNEMQQLAEDYRKMIANKKEILDNMVTYNETAKAGENFRKGSMQKKDPKSGKIVDYYKDFNTDNMAGLSFDECQKMIKQYVIDNYAIGEGEQGVEMNFGSGDDVETIMVSPEAIAFRAGWESQTGTGTGRGKAEEKQISDTQAIINAKNELLGGKTHLKMSDEELIKSVMYNKNLYEGIDNRMKGSDYPLGMTMELAGTGDFLATEVAYQLGAQHNIDRSTIHQYSAAYTNYNQGIKEMLKRQIELPGKVTQTSGILTQMQVSNDQAIQIMQDFNTYNSNPDTLLMQINTYEPSGTKGVPKEQLHQAYADFLRQLPTMDPQKRRDGIQRFTKLIGQ